MMPWLRSRRTFVFSRDAIARLEKIRQLADLPDIEAVIGCALDAFEQQVSGAEPTAAGLRGATSDPEQGRLSRGSSDD